MELMYDALPQSVMYLLCILNYLNVIFDTDLFH